MIQENVKRSKCMILVLLNFENKYSKVKWFEDRGRLFPFNTALNFSTFVTIVLLLKVGDIHDEEFKHLLVFRTAVPIVHCSS